jgi:RNA polymerase sigma-70 factor (ECF subfamily)
MNSTVPLQSQVPRRYGDAGQTPDSAARFRRSPAVDRSDARQVQERAVRAARAGDQDALRFLYLRYKDNVYGFVCSIVQDEHEAEDVTQQVFAKAMQALPSYETRGEIPFSGWLLRIARNAAIDHLRQRRPLPSAELYEPGAHASADETAPLTLRGALDTLPEDQRKVVLMRHVLGLTPAEIAGELGRSEPSVHGLHHRGRRALRQELVRVEAAPSLVTAS